MRFPGEEEALLWAWQDLSDRIAAGDCMVPVKHNPQAMWTWLSLSTELDGVLCLTVSVPTTLLDVDGLPLQHQDCACLVGA